jgi:hypothetical protein
MSILNLLRSDEQSRIDAAWRRYAALLESDSPDPKALTELKSVMQTLGKGTADAESDAQVLKEARRLVDVIQDGLGLDGQREEAHKAANEYAAETERIVLERAQEIRRLQGVGDALSARWMLSDRSHKQLMLMRSRHVKLVGYIQSPGDH